MKTKILFTALLVVSALWGLKAQPSELFNDKVDVQLAQNMQIQVMYMNAANENVSIKIHDANKQLIEQRTIKGSGHLKIGVIVRNLENGRYDVSVFANKKLIRIERIEIYDGELVGLPVLLKSATINYALL